MVGGVGYILAVSGWWWVVGDGSGWWWMVVDDSELWWMVVGGCIV